MLRNVSFLHNNDDSDSCDNDRRHQGCSNTSAFLENSRAKNEIILKSLPNDTILDCSKLKAIADDKINVTEKLKVFLGKGKKHCGKRRKCWLHNVFKRLLF